VAKHLTASGYSGRTCSTATCHANVYGSGSVTSPVWGATAGCDACHTTAIATTGPATGSHAVHATADCSKCHTGATNSTTVPSANHIDGNIDVNSGYTANVAKHLTASGYSGRTCSTATCHANVYGSGSVTSPVWGATAGCEACHTITIGTNGPDTGSHTAHAGKACTTCHAAGTTATSSPSLGNGHTDGNVDVYYFNYPADVPKHSSASYTGTCSTAWCHSNGKGNYATATWGGTSTGCNFCHPTLSGKHSVHTISTGAAYGSTADNSDSSAYNFGCGNCHPTDVGNHINTTIEITLNSLHGGVLKSKNSVNDDSTGFTRNPGVSVTCAAAYCHSNGMATPTFYGAGVDWYEASYSGDKCARCHGNSPNSGGKVGSAAHGAHVVGIHVDDIYNGVSKKMPIGGGIDVNAAHGRNNRSTTINCNVCHALTVSAFENDKNSACIGCHDNSYAPFKGNASIANKAKHVNGSVDVSFINQKIATKAQVAKAAFAGYTAANAGSWTRNSNSMTFKTYTSSYDVSKYTLFASASWSQADGCANVACHNGKSVKWTDTVSCTNCHTRLR
jgi:predicted CxxxxCH...CXXCH cytochrome family protein